MSNSSDDEIPGAAAGAAAASADVEDLTNTDSDDDVPAPHQGGSYVGLGKYALSLRKREAVSHERPASPMVVTPRPPSNSSSGSGSETSPATKKVRKLSLSTSPRSPKARAGGNDALSSLKPRFEAGHPVYAAWWPPSDPKREGKAAWYPGTVQSYRVEGTSCYGHVRIYRIKYDDGDELGDLEDFWVFDKQDYELTREYAKKFAETKWEPIGVLGPIYDAKSSDEWARKVGWYVVREEGGTERRFALFSKALKAHDDYVVREHRGRLHELKESFLNLPGNYPDLFALQPSQGEDEAEDSESSCFFSDSSQASRFSEGDDSDDDPGGLFTDSESDEASIPASGNDYVPPCIEQVPCVELQAIEKGLKKERASSLVTDAAVVPVIRYEREYYYLMIVWGKRMLATELSLGDGPPPIRLNNFGREYELVYSELVSREGKGKHFDKMGQKYFKSFYVAVAGLGLESLDLKSALLSIGDFESLSHAKGAHKTLSRLKLLVSPSCKFDGVFCVHRRPKDDFEMIEENGHMGCGFIPRNLLLQLLGKGVPAQRVFAVQVRVIGPSSVGICKGMLFVKPGITKIQLPTSMLKVDKSTSRKPLHTDVVLNILRVFPSKTHEALGKLFNDKLENPCFSSLGDLKPLSEDVLRVLKGKWVSDSILDQYMTEFREAKAKIGWVNRNRKSKRMPNGLTKDDEKRHMNELKQQYTFNHANLVGVSDPTGTIPSGHVFLTGMDCFAPSKILITRNPCATAKDGIVVPVASWRDMTEDAFRFLSKWRFGAVVFPLGDELASTINNGDLDGDLYLCIWDDRIVGSIIDGPSKGELDGGPFEDELVQMEFLHNVNGKAYDSVVKEKLEGSADDMYLVETGPKDARTFIELTGEEIRNDTDCIVEVVGHKVASVGAKRKSRKKIKSIDFHCQWQSGESNWQSAGDIRDTHSGPPEALIEYMVKENLVNDKLLPREFYKWVNDDIVDAVIEEIVKHKTVCGKVEVLCKYNDCTEVWHPFEDVKEDFKVELGAYAKKKKLFRRRGWEGSDGFWLEGVYDIIKQNRCKEINQLVSTLHGMMEGASCSLGCNHPDTVRWGDAYNKSLEVEKHGGKLTLPYDLRSKLSKKLKEFVMIE